MHTVHRRFGLVSIAGLLASSALAPASAQSLPFDPADTIRIGEGYAYSSADAFGRTEVGHLTDDLRLDVVYDKATEGGKHLYFASGPGVYDSVFQINPGSGSNNVLCQDFCILPGGGSDGPDGIVLIGDDGLEIWAWDESEAKFVKTLISGTSAWDDVKRIRVGNLDGDDPDVPDLIGLDPDEPYDLKVIYDLTPQTANPTTVTLDWSGSGAIYDFVLANWLDDTPADLEIAVLAANGFKVIDVDQAEADAVFSAGSAASSGDLVIPIDYPGTTRDRIAVLIDTYDVFTQSWNLLLFVATNPTSGSASMVYCTNLGQIPVVGGAAANVDGDANNRPELILSQCLDDEASTNDELVLLKHLNVEADSSSATYSFTLNNFLILDAGNPTTDPHTSWPCAGDIDNDGDNDIVYSIEDSDSPFVAVMPSRFINKAEKQFSMDPGGYGSSWSGELENFTLDLTLNNPETPLELGSGHTNALHVTLWIHDQGEDAQGLKPEEEPTALENTMVDITWQTTLLTLEDLHGDWDGTFELPGHWVHSIVVREVELDEEDDVVIAGPDYVLCVSEEVWLNEDLMLQFGGLQSAIEVDDFEEGGNVLMGALPLSRVPHIKKDKFLKDKPPQ
jgi:hypothetical protein